MIAPVFLSASEPNPERDKDYTISANVVNLREAVRAFCAHVLPNFPLVFGGHPAITPFVRTAARRIAYDLEHDPELAEQARLKAPQVLMYQSLLFFDAREPAPDEVFTPPLNKDGVPQPARHGWRNESLLLMRYEMLGRPVPPHQVHPAVRPYADHFGTARRERLGTEAFSAAVFIGGMEGVEREFHIFRSFHPDAPAFPIVSTGSACKKLMEHVENDLRGIAPKLRQDTAYSLLMQQILPIDETPARAVGWSAKPVGFEAEQHMDPESINREFPVKQ